MCDLTDCPASFNSVYWISLFVNLAWTYLWYNEESIFVIVFLGSSQWHVYFLFKFIDRLMVLISSILYSVSVSWWKRINIFVWLLFEIELYKKLPNFQLTPCLCSGQIQELITYMRHYHGKLLLWLVNL